MLGVTNFSISYGVHLLRLNPAPFQADQAMTPCRYSNSSPSAYNPSIYTDKPLVTGLVISPIEQACTIEWISVPVSPERWKCHFAYGPGISKWLLTQFKTTCCNDIYQLNQLHTITFCPYLLLNKHPADYQGLQRLGALFLPILNSQKPQGAFQTIRCGCPYLAVVLYALKHSHIKVCEVLKVPQSHLLPFLLNLCAPDGLLNSWYHYKLQKGLFISQPK